MFSMSKLNYDETGVHQTDGLSTHNHSVNDYLFTTELQGNGGNPTFFFLPGTILCRCAIRSTDPWQESARFQGAPSTFIQGDCINHLIYSCQKNPR